MKTYRKLSQLIALTGALIISALPMGRAEEKKKTDESKIQLMFVQTAEDLKADGNTLRLVNVGQQTLYFSDRPVRIAGHLTMPAYMDEWKAGEGPDNFSSDPPNATLSVYESGNHENTLAVVKISHPAVDGKDLVYNYKLIEGTMPKAGGATALFIDWGIVGLTQGFPLTESRNVRASRHVKACKYFSNCGEPLCCSRRSCVAALYRRMCPRVFWGGCDFIPENDKVLTDHV